MVLSRGEMVRQRLLRRGTGLAVLFAFHAGMKGVLLDPHPAALSGDVALSLVGRDAYVSSLLETRSHHPEVGARL